ncbi:hypothetical protein IWQ60_004284 [Tieghemiomyces parasiticus]|uniref:Protein phosphatase 1 regulatory subunit 21 N-terminal domain-containing protein n=1 Tax=Tieghemiomyces parasiticus TaxID=78921 RepID=A0A9W8DZA2_9FUNG|nr:hypothetical protein IWQ60_004284 [Tieghemiomyces parasiticus]
MSDSPLGTPLPLDLARSPSHSGLRLSDIVPGDSLAHKYQKLFSDYTRVKAQHAVLKQAVVQLRDKNHQLAADHDDQQLAAKELRSQMEGYEFNNRRLTRRLDALQSELARAKSTGRSAWFGGKDTQRDLSSAREALEALGSDLQAKIDENEELHSMLAEARAALTGRTRALEMEVAQLQADRTAFQDQLTQHEDADRPKLKQYQRKLANLSQELDTLQTDHSALRIQLTCAQGERGYLQARHRLGRQLLASLATALGAGIPRRFDQVVMNHFRHTASTLQQAWRALRAQVVGAKVLFQPEVVQRHEALMQDCVDRLGGTLLTIPRNARGPLLAHLGQFYQWYFSYLLEMASPQDFYRDTYQQLIDKATTFTTGTWHPDFAPYFALHDLTALMTDKVVELRASPFQLVADVTAALAAVCLWKFYPWKEDAVGPHGQNDDVAETDMFAVDPWPAELMAVQRLHADWYRAYDTLQTGHRQTTETLKRLESEKRRLEVELQQATQRAGEDRKRSQQAGQFANQKMEKLTLTLQQLSAEIVEKKRVVEHLTRELEQEKQASSNFKDALHFNLDHFEQERRQLAESCQRTETDLKNAQQKSRELEKALSDRTRQTKDNQQRELVRMQQDLEQQQLREREQFSNIITELTHQVTALQEELIRRDATVPLAPQSATTGSEKSTTSSELPNGHIAADATDRPEIAPAPEIPNSNPPAEVQAPTDDAAEEIGAPVLVSASPNGEADSAIPSGHPNQDPATPSSVEQTTAKLAADFLVRERETAAYYDVIIAKLNVQLEITDSKAVEFHTAWTLASQRLQQVDQEKTVAHQHLGSLQERIAQLEVSLSFKA